MIQVAQALLPVSPPTNHKRNPITAMPARAFECYKNKYLFTYYQLCAIMGRV